MIFLERKIMSDEKVELYKISDKQLVERFEIDPTNRILMEVLVERFTLYSKFINKHSWN